MKTPEEIKKGLEIHASDEACTEHSCPYCGGVSGKLCTQVMAEDALAYIQQLEHENKDLLEERELNDCLRDKVKQLEAAHRTEYCEEADYDCKALGEARKRIAELEAIDAEPVRHGRWIQSKAVPSYHHCSCCKRAHNMPMSCNVYVLPYYCMDCGAKMDLEVQDD